MTAKIKAKTKNLLIEKTKMRKIITIGESVLDMLFRDGLPERSFVGGRIANSAAALGQLGLPVSMVSECGADRVGDMVVDFLSTHNVDVKSVDRFTDGTTAFSAIFCDTGKAKKIVNYGRYPADRFDVVWPRIDEDDIVLFGSLYAIDTPQRERLFELISYAAERKAIIVYLPGFQHGINMRITRVMPAILENLEIADIVIAHERDINNIFPGETSEQAFRNHIEFYCPTYLHINPDLGVTLFSTGKRHDFAHSEALATDNLLGWQSGFAAGIIYMILRNGLTRDQVAATDDDTCQGIIGVAKSFAAECASTADNCLTQGFAEQRKADLEVAMARQEELKNK